MKTLIALVIVLFTSLTFAQDELTPREIYQNTSSSVVMVFAYNSEGMLLRYGSGVVVSLGGIVYTNYHVIKESARIEVRSDEIIYDSIPLIGFDPFIDAAILQLPSSHDCTYPAVEPDTASNSAGRISTGEVVYALGNPQGYKKTFSEGIVSALRDYDYPGQIQFTAAIAPGSSGGALLNSHGRLIGITTSAITTAQNMGFAVPVHRFRGIITVNLNDSAQKQLLTRMIGMYSKNLALTFEERIKTITEYCSLKGDDEFKLEFAGKFCHSQGEHDSSIVYFTRAIELNPGNPMLYRLRAKSYAECSDTMRVLEDISFALALKSDYLDAYLDRANYYEYTLRDYRNAIEDYDKVVKIDPEYDYIYTHTASCRLSLNDRTGAINELSRGLVWCNTDPDVYILRAKMYSSLGMYEEAIDDYTAALEIAPAYTEIYLSRAVLYSRREDITSAISDYVEYLRHDSEEPLANNNLAYCYMDIGETDLAEKHFKRSLESNKYHTDSYIGLAILYYRQGRIKLAVQNMCRATEIKDELLSGMPGLALMESDGWFWSDDQKQVIKKIFQLMGIADSMPERKRNINPRAQKERAVDAEE